MTHYDAWGEEIDPREEFTPEELAQYRQQIADRPRSVLRAVRAARDGALLLVVALLLAACGGAGNADPRKGRVVLDESNCLFGDCYQLYELCLGPDLRVIYSDRAGDDDYARIDEDSPECAR